MTESENNNAVAASLLPIETVSGAAANEISAKEATVILQFLQRTQMQGAEMPVYVDVFNKLSGIVAASQDGSATA